MIGTCYPDATGKVPPGILQKNHMVWLDCIQHGLIDDLDVKSEKRYSKD